MAKRKNTGLTKQQERNILLSKIRSLPKPTVEGNLGLVREEALPYRKRNQKLEDTDQYSDGLIGLWEATQSYNVEMGMFSTYAVKCIQNRIAMGHRWRSAKKREMHTLEPSSLDAFVKHDMESSDLPAGVLDVLMEDSPTDTPAFKRKKNILRMHYIDNKNWREIGDTYHITRNGARLLAVSAIEEIREKFSDLLKQYA